MVKFGVLHFGSLDSQVRILVMDLHHLSSHAVAVTHIQNRGRIGTDVSSGPISLTKNKQKIAIRLFY